MSEMEAEAAPSPGPWKVDGDEEGLEFDIFDSDDFIIAAIEDQDDPGVSKKNAYLIANAWQMRADITTAIKMLREGEDTEALKLLKATLQKCEPVQSSHGRADDGGATQGEAGGAGR